MCPGHARGATLTSSSGEAAAARRASARWPSASRCRCSTSRLRDSTCRIVVLAAPGDPLHPAPAAASRRAASPTTRRRRSLSDRSWVMSVYHVEKPSTPFEILNFPQMPFVVSFAGHVTSCCRAHCARFPWDGWPMEVDGQEDLHEYNRPLISLWRADQHRYPPKRRNRYRNQWAAVKTAPIICAGQSRIDAAGLDRPHTGAFTDN